MKIIKKIKFFLSLLDIGITRYRTLIELENKSIEYAEKELLFKLYDGNNGNELFKYFNMSYSQLKQDIFVLSFLKFKQNGYFVEFGATDGISLANTYLLEKKFGWTGILAEPARCWHNALQQNRASHIEKKCVWTSTNDSLNFVEVDVPEFSTINDYKDSDSNKNNRIKNKNYVVTTISLIDLLRKYDSPKKIDYLSIDTEGSEYDILKNFDFSEYKFKIITCEHNYTDKREKIYNLLISNGYKRVLEDFSQFDDWYVLK
jgi:FkbM family methyltransferase